MGGRGPSIMRAAERLSFCCRKCRRNCFFWTKPCRMRKSNRQRDGSLPLEVTIRLALARWTQGIKASGSALLFGQSGALRNLWMNGVMTMREWFFTVSQFFLNSHVCQLQEDVPRLMETPRFVRQMRRSRFASWLPLLLVAAHAASRAVRPHEPTFHDPMWSPQIISHRPIRSRFHCEVFEEPEDKIGMGKIKIQTRKTETRNTQTKLSPRKALQELANFIYITVSTSYYPLSSLHFGPSLMFDLLIFPSFNPLIQFSLSTRSFNLSSHLTIRSIHSFHYVRILLNFFENCFCHAHVGIPALSATSERWIREVDMFGLMVGLYLNNTSHSRLLILTRTNLKAGFVSFPMFREWKRIAEHSCLDSLDIARKLSG